MRQASNKPDWTTINSLTHRAANRHVFNRRLSAAAVCRAAEQVGAALFTTVSFKDGCLKVRVASYDAVGEVMRQQTAVVEAINQQLGETLVTTLRISVNALAKEDDYE